MGLWDGCNVRDLWPEHYHKDDAEREIEFARDGSCPEIDRHYRHPRCFAAWEFERTKLDARRPEA